MPRKGARGGTTAAGRAGAAAQVTEVPSAPAHTFQLVVLLLLQASLLVLAVLYIPQGIFSRSLDRPRPTLYSGIYDMLNPPDQHDPTAVTQKMTQALKGVFVIQSWVVSRLRWWWEVGQKIEKRESITELKKKQGLMKQAESLVLTTTALPIPLVLCFLLLMLFGAPVNGQYTPTLTLAAHLTLLGLYAPLHILGEDFKSWLRIFSSWPANAREKVLLVITVGPLFGAWLSSAALALDWNRPWQAWPTPCVLGALAGTLGGNVVAIFIYLFRRSQSSREG
ncbi:hypothetical protein K437DRAFT_258461 [Tilletiaria anomala UBC 951]|uniref:PIG-F-domain-containing protein n=1 Tax=Tilletiaria anomala (strain ATCC 24038 / CBS 436.72 / UBC 951) TaxID=1037660 RepID=A0A066VHK4_TILAU|nr:uncharacterized protein K437DRAFT_258461 [Tilletiaria anomala UBC 951]KDN40961.1 hypothetical protein K437DRAFT_258461 [Tilletiaria anomala UBC 951]